MSGAHLEERSISGEVMGYSLQFRLNVGSRATASRTTVYTKGTLLARALCGEERVVKCTKYLLLNVRKRHSRPDRAACHLAFKVPRTAPHQLQGTAMLRPSTRNASDRDFSFLSMSVLQPFILQEVASYKCENGTVNLRSLPFRLFASLLRRCVPTTPCGRCDLGISVTLPADCPDVGGSRRYE